MENRCISCGEIIPEGRQVCKECDKKTLDHMTQLLGKVRKVEQYHEKRIYIPRVKE